MDAATNNTLYIKTSLTISLQRSHNQKIIRKYVRWVRKCQVLRNNNIGPDVLGFEILTKSATFHLLKLR